MSEIRMKGDEIILAPKGRSDTETGSRGRRKVLTTLAAAGAGGAVFVRAVTALARQAGEVTPAMIEQAQWISGIAFTEEERELMAAGVAEALEDHASLRAVPLDNSVAPAIRFDAVPPGQLSTCTAPTAPDLMPRRDRPGPPVDRPSDDDDLAFLTGRRRGDRHPGPRGYPHTAK